MKKFLSIAFMLLICSGAFAQTEGSTKLLKRYSALVERVSEKYMDNPDSVAAWRAERKLIQELYKARYKSQFTDDEIEQYFTINTKYRKKTSQAQLNDLGEKVDSLGNTLGKHFNRLSRKLSGVLKEINNQSEENRKGE